MLESPQSAADRLEELESIRDKLTASLIDLARSTDILPADDVAGGLGGFDALGGLGDAGMGLGFFGGGFDAGPAGGAVDLGALPPLGGPVGDLGPPQLSKYLFELYLIRAAWGELEATVTSLREPGAGARLEELLNDLIDLRDMIISVGIIARVKGTLIVIRVPSAITE